MLVISNSEELQGEYEYWRSLQLSETARLPIDYEGGENSVASRRVIGVALSEAQTEALLQQVPQVYHTQINDVLLTALAQALRNWTGAERHLIALEGHGREELFAEVDVSRTMGWFTSVFPVILDLAGANDVGVALKSIKEQLRAIPRRGIGYGILRYLSGIEEFTSAPQPQLVFNYLGQFDQERKEADFLRSATEGSG
jgi:hypothetical protein